MALSPNALSDPREDRPQPRDILLETVFSGTSWINPIVKAGRHGEADLKPLLAVMADLHHLQTAGREMPVIRVLFEACEHNKSWAELLADLGHTEVGTDALRDFMAVASQVNADLAPVLEGMYYRSGTQLEGLTERLADRAHALALEIPYPNDSLHAAAAEVGRTFGVGRTKQVAARAFTGHVSPDPRAPLRYMPIGALQYVLRVLRTTEGVIGDQSQAGPWVLARLVGDIDGGVRPQSYKELETGAGLELGHQQALCAELERILKAQIDRRPARAAIDATGVKRPPGRPRGSGKRSGAAVALRNAFEFDEDLAAAEAAAAAASAPAVEPDEPDLDDDRVGEEVRDGVRWYLQQIGKRRLLQPEEEVELAKQVEAGVAAAEQLATETVKGRARTALRRAVTAGEAAKVELWEANLRLVVSIARRYARNTHHMSMLDIAQEGNIGLLKAVNKFDYTMGYKFSTYATWWIRQAIDRAIADQDRDKRIPVHMHEHIRKVKRARRDLTQDLDREPTVEEIALELDPDGETYTPERVTTILLYDRRETSLDRPVGDDGDTELGDLVATVDDDHRPDAVALDNVRDENMVAALRQLPHMERWVVSHRYYDDQTLDDLARASGLSRERIRQLELRGLALLRDLLENWRDAEAVGRVGGKVLPEVNTRPTSLLQALPDDLADQVRQVCRNDEALIDSLLDAGLDTITPSRVEALSIKYRHGAHKDRQRTMADTHGAPAHLVKSGLETLVSNLRHMLKGDFSEVDLGKARGRVRSPTALLIECGVRIAIPGSRETRQKQALAAVMRSELSKREKGLIILAYGLTGDPQPQNLFGITRMLEKLRDAFGTS